MMITILSVHGIMTSEHTTLQDDTCASCTICTNYLSICARSPFLMEIRYCPGCAAGWPVTWSSWYSGRGQMCQASIRPCSWCGHADGWGVPWAGTPPSCNATSAADQLAPAGSRVPDGPLSTYKSARASGHVMDVCRPFCSCVPQIVCL